MQPNIQNNSKFAKMLDAKTNGIRNYSNLQTNKVFSFYNERLLNIITDEAFITPNGNSNSPEFLNKRKKYLILLLGDLTKEKNDIFKIIEGNSNIFSVNNFITKMHMEISKLELKYRVLNEENANLSKGLKNLDGDDAELYRKFRILRIQESEMLTAQILLTRTKLKEFRLQNNTTSIILAQKRLKDLNEKLLETYSMLDMLSEDMIKEKRLEINKQIAINQIDMDDIGKKVLTLKDQIFLKNNELTKLKNLDDIAKRIYSNETELRTINTKLESLQMTN